MQTNPLVSVIVPAFDVEKYIAEAIQSVYAQTYRPLQLIVINDGSNDATDQVIRQLISEVPAEISVEYIDQENTGVVSATNRAFGLVKGDYFLRLDGDDRIPPQYVAKLCGSLQSQPEKCSYVYTDFTYFGARSGVVRAGDFNRNRLLVENYIHCAALVRTKVVREIGYLNENMLHGFEDWDHWLLHLEHGYYGTYVSGVSLDYRQKKEGEILSGRNDMGAKKDKAMRLQIQRNHPSLYRFNSGQFYVLLWRLKRKLFHIVGISQ